MLSMRATLRCDAMADLPYRSALIIGAGPGISSALARSLTGLGVIVSLGARNVEKLATLVEETGARPFTVDASQADSVAALFDRVSADTGDPEIVIFNAAAPLRGPLAELDPLGVQRSIATTAFGGFLAAHHAARTMVPRGSESACRMRSVRSSPFLLPTKVRT